MCIKRLSCAGTARSGALLVLHPDGPAPQLAFEIDGGGCFRHRETGLYVHPANGDDSHDQVLICRPDGAVGASSAEIQREIQFKFEHRLDTSDMPALSSAVAQAELEHERLQAAAKLLEADMSGGSSTCSDMDSDVAPAYGPFEGYTAPAVVVDGDAAEAAQLSDAPLPSQPPSAPVAASAPCNDSPDERANQRALEQRRNTLLHLVQEILRTEDDFQANINFAICKPLFFLQAYLFQMGEQVPFHPRNQNNQSVIILQSGFGEDDVELLKCNLPDICRCSMNFLKKLETANNDTASGSPLLFGHVFKSFIPKFLDIYSHYCANFEEHAVVILQKLSQGNVMALLPPHHIHELEASEEWQKSGRSLQVPPPSPATTLLLRVNHASCSLF